MNVVIYARYSSNGQTENSIEKQLRECNEFASKNGFIVIDQYIDRAKTGTNDNRPQFLKMLEDSKNKNFEGVIVHQLDRFARNRHDSAVNKAILRMNNVRVFSARENISEDASGILMESVLEGMAEYFSVELSQKVKRGMSLNAEKYYYNGGSVPLGLKLEIAEQMERVGNKPKIKYKYVIDDETAPIIKKVFKMYINGSCMADIIKYLNSQQLKTSYGNEFNRSSIRRLLLNKKYIGIYTYNGEEHLNAIPSIINEDVFKKVQDMILKNKYAPARARAKTDYLLTTKLFCGCCNNLMTGTSGTSKSGKLHTYYSCTNKKNGCIKQNVQKDSIEDLVVSKAREILTDENITYIAKTVVDLANKENNVSNIKRLNKLMNANEKKKNNLFDSLKICEIDSVKKSIFEEIAKMEDIQINLKQEIINEESKCVKVLVPQVKFFLKQIRNGKVNDIRYKKMLIDVLIYKVILYNDSFTIFFSTQEEKFTAKLPTSEVVKCSCKGDNALPFMI